MSLFERATNPKQYDLPDLEWSGEAGLESPQRSYFWRKLTEQQPEWKNASVLDIGAGSGWLLEEAQKLGARTTIGIEPAKANIDIGRKRYPSVTLVESSLEGYETNLRFSIAVSVMSISHIGDLNQAFFRIAELLERGGRFYLVAPDYDYFKQQRRDCRVEIEERSPDEFVACHMKPTRVLSDVVRKNHAYIDAAAATGLVLESHVELKPDEIIMTNKPSIGNSQTRRFVICLFSEKSFEKKRKPPHPPLSGGGLN